MSVHKRVLPNLQLSSGEKRTVQMKNIIPGAIKYGVEQYVTKLGKEVIDIIQHSEQSYNVSASTNRHNFPELLYHYTSQARAGAIVASKTLHGSLMDRAHGTGIYTSAYHPADFQQPARPTQYGCPAFQLAKTLFTHQTRWSDLEAVRYCVCLPVKVLLDAGYEIRVINRHKKHYLIRHKASTSMPIGHSIPFEIFGPQNNKGKFGVKSYENMVDERRQVSRSNVVPVSPAIQKNHGGLGGMAGNVQNNPNNVNVPNDQDMMHAPLEDLLPPEDFLQNNIEDIVQNNIRDIESQPIYDPYPIETAVSNRVNPLATRILPHLNPLVTRLSANSNLSRYIMCRGNTGSYLSQPQEALNGRAVLDILQNPNDFLMKFEERKIKRLNAMNRALGTSFIRKYEGQEEYEWNMEDYEEYSRRAYEIKQQEEEYGVRFELSGSSGDLLGNHQRVSRRSNIFGNRYRYRLFKKTLKIKKKLRQGIQDIQKIREERQNKVIWRGSNALEREDDNYELTDEQISKIGYIAKRLRAKKMKVCVIDYYKLTHHDELKALQKTDDRYLDSLNHITSSKLERPKICDSRKAKNLPKQSANKPSETNIPIDDDNTKTAKTNDTSDDDFINSTAFNFTVEQISASKCNETAKLHRMFLKRREKDHFDMFILNDKHLESDEIFKARLYSKLREYPRPDKAEISLGDGCTLAKIENLKGFEAKKTTATFIEKPDDFPFFSKRWPDTKMTNEYGCLISNAYTLGFSLNLDVVNELYMGKTSLPRDLENCENQLADLCCEAKECRLITDDKHHEDVDMAGDDDDDDECIICLNAGTEEEPMSEIKKCGHRFHKACLATWCETRAVCPMCKDPLGIIIGCGPKEGEMACVENLIKVQFPVTNNTETYTGIRPLPQFEPNWFMKVLFNFPEGIDRNGRKYVARKERAYLREDGEGFTLLKLYQIAMKRRVMFGIGERMRTGEYYIDINYRDGA